MAVAACGGVGMFYDDFAAAKYSLLATSHGAQWRLFQPLTAAQ